MDLVVGAKRVIVATTHQTPRRESRRLLPECTYPLTAREEVDVLVTEHAVFRFEKGKMILVDIGDHLALEDLKSITPAEYEIHPHLKVVNRWGKVKVWEVRLKKAVSRRTMNRAFSSCGPTESARVHWDGPFVRSMAGQLTWPRPFNFPRLTPKGSSVYIVYEHLNQYYHLPKKDGP